MPAFKLNPLHQRVMDALPVGEEVTREQLFAHAGLRIDEVLSGIVDLIAHGYVTTRTRANGRGGLDHLYTRLETPLNLKEPTVEREPLPPWEAADERLVHNGSELSRRRRE